VKTDRGLSPSSEEGAMCEMGDWVRRLLGLLGLWTFFYNYRCWGAELKSVARLLSRLGLDS